MRKKRNTSSKSWITVGVKLLFGVALASNCLIGILLYNNEHSAQNIERMVGEVLAIRKRVDLHLRETIVRLQRELITLPQLFVTDPKQAILKQVQHDFTVEEQQQLVGREAYAAFFSRTERRDLAKGLPVTKVDNSKLMLSFGVLDEQGVFTDAVMRMHLTSTQPNVDLARLRQLVAAASAKGHNLSDLEKKIEVLRKAATDKSIEAEKTRTEILGYVDYIKAKEHQMAQANAQRRSFSLMAGLAAIVGNVLVLFLLTRFIVEKPLRRLTDVVDALGSGNYPEIPWQNRRDQIGTLSVAIGRFREALLDLKHEKERKVEEQQIIESLVGSMTASIQHLSDRAGQLCTMSLSLQDLAEVTEGASKNVAGLAGDTAARTDEVLTSSQQISDVVEEINTQLEAQINEVTHIVKEIGQARAQLTELKQSVLEIDAIVVAVHAITDQTKILAINATIEAVKAGAHGRGFAVVADEVKKLSQNTALATRDVMDKLKTINATCQSFIDCFDTVDQGAEQLHQVTAAIRDAVALQKNLTRAIVDLADRTSGNTQQVSSRINDVNDAAAGVLRLSSDAHQCADEIATFLGEFQQGSVRRLESLTTSTERNGTLSDSATMATESTVSLEFKPTALQKPVLEGEGIHV
jgi:methyl-accepting chemotaxis protein